MSGKRTLTAISLCALAVLWTAPAATAYIEVPYSLGRLVLARDRLGLKPLYLEAMGELRGFDQWAVRSVRREHNERADELVNEALDRALS